MKIIQIDGIRGLITAAFIIVCLFAGFVMFPGLVAMYLWNKYLVSAYMFPVLNVFQGVLLWGITVITYCILSKKGLSVSFKDTPELSDDEINNILQRSKITPKMQIVKRIISSKPEIPADKDQTYISSPVTSVKNAAEDKEEEKVSNLK